jgi:hypothetical protein
MSPKQMQKWSVIRSGGRKDYLLTRTLRWGALLSLAEIVYSAFVKVITTPMVDALFYATFSKPRVVDTEELMVRFVGRQIFQVMDCFLLAGFLALAVWTYKEQSYGASTTSEPNQS